MEYLPVVSHYLIDNYVLIYYVRYNIWLLNYQIINIFNLTNCIREPTRLGALLDPILFSDELETTFSDVIQVDRIKSDHDATIAFFPIPYDLQTNYKREVWLYKHGNYDGLNSEIDQFDWNSHLSSLNDIDEMSSKLKFVFARKNVCLPPSHKL